MKQTISKKLKPAGYTLLILSLASFASSLQAKAPLKPAKAEPAPAVAESAPATAASTPIDLELGAIIGYNPNIELTRNGNAYLAGTDAFGIPVWTFGARAKKDFDVIGVRAAFQYSFSPERIHTDSTTATPAVATKETGYSITIPVSFCINAIKNDKAAIFVGVGMTYSSYSSDSITAAATRTTKSSGIDWNFLFGTEVFINSKFGISLEYMMIRGYDNQASYTQTGSTLSSVAINRNVDQFLLAANLRL